LGAHVAGGREGRLGRRLPGLRCLGGGGLSLVAPPLVPAMVAALVPAVVAATLVTPILAALAPLAGLLLALAALAGLALTLGQLALRPAQHAGVLLGMLQETLLRHAVAGQLGIARQRQILVDDLLRRAAHLPFRAGAVEDAVDDIAQRALAVRLVART